MSNPGLRRTTGGVAIALLAAACCGCSPLAWGIAGGSVAGLCAYAPSRWNHAYQTRYQAAGVRELESDTCDVRIGFVEYDDFGWMRDTLQARVLLDQIQDLQRRTNVAVIVYAHGWRHNAKDGDADVESFKATLRHLGQNLNASHFRRRREALTGDPGMTIFGVYVGWRGKAWPELGRLTRGWGYLAWIGPLTLDLPVYFTSFGRKQSAGVVGGGDVRSFLLRLDDMHREVNSRARENPRDTKPLGLVYVGHSYGGHLLFSALGSRVEDGMASAIAGSMTAGQALLSRRVYPRPGDAEALVCERPVPGVGDLLVLVNPAIEASAYRRIDGMVRSTRFRDDQLPLMVTVSAENDGARNFVFAVMRTIQLFGRAKQSRAQSRQEGRAFGSYADQITHQMELRDRDGESRRRARVRVIEEGRDQLSVRRAEVRLAEPGATRGEMRPEDIFAEHDHGVVRMRADAGQGAPRPALVVRSRRDVIDGHSDFFRVEFIDWLTDYVLGIEQLRLANAMRAAGATAD